MLEQHIRILTVCMSNGALTINLLQVDAGLLQEAHTLCEILHAALVYFTFEVLLKAFRRMIWPTILCRAHESSGGSCSRQLPRKFEMTVMSSLTALSDRSCTELCYPRFHPLSSCLNTEAVMLWSGLVLCAHSHRCFLHTAVNGALQDAGKVPVSCTEIKGVDILVHSPSD
jgi:hypothetical protein